MIFEVLLLSTASHFKHSVVFHNEHADCSQRQQKSQVRRNQTGEHHLFRGDFYPLLSVIFLASGQSCQAVNIQK